MVGTTRDLMSVVEEVRVYYARFRESEDDSLTTIQKQAARGRLIKEFTNNGISFEDHGGEGAFVRWTSARVRGTGIIVDVHPLGSSPIILCVGDDVTVHFEPRDLTTVGKLSLYEISNVEFAQLKKGSACEFQGRISSCRYSFKQAGAKDCFEFGVDNDPIEGTRRSIRQAYRYAEKLNKDFSQPQSARRTAAIYKAYFIDLPIAVFMNTIGKLLTRKK
jgi:hypothetical protein